MNALSLFLLMASHVLPTVTTGRVASSVESPLIHSQVPSRRGPSFSIVTRAPIVMPPGHTPRYLRGRLFVICNISADGVPEVNHISGSIEPAIPRSHQRYAEAQVAARVFTDAARDSILAWRFRLPFAYSGVLFATPHLRPGRRYFPRYLRHIDD